MHQLFGLLYQKTLYNLFKEKNQRTYLDVRSSNAFASPYPAALYSDTYDHKAYIQMIANSGFSGLLWSPEVREAGSVQELFMRSQTAVMSAQALFNSWYLQHPPWLQFDKGKNNNGNLLAESVENEAIIKKLFGFRMSLIPYLYSAFHQYQSTGKPPFRGLVTDYPQDKEVYSLDDEYLIGNNLLAAPFYNGKTTRTVYLPEGIWYNFNTREKLVGGQAYSIDFKPDELPLFVKSGTILPLANPVDYVGEKTVFELNCQVYGDAVKPCSLFEDDGISFDYKKGQFNTVTLSLPDERVELNRTGSYAHHRYQVVQTTRIE